MTRYQPYVQWLQVSAFKCCHCSQLLLSMIAQIKSICCPDNTNTKSIHNKWPTSRLLKKKQVVETVHISHLYAIYVIHIDEGAE